MPYVLSRIERPRGLCAADHSRTTTCWRQRAVRHMATQKGWLFVIADVGCSSLRGFTVKGLADATGDAPANAASKIGEPNPSSPTLMQLFREPPKKRGRTARVTADVIASSPPRAVKPAAIASSPPRAAKRAKASGAAPDAN